MRIALLNELYPPSVGGQENRSSGLARALVARGHEVDVYVIRHDLSVPKDETVDGVHVHRWPNAPRYKRPVIKPLKRGLIAMIAYSVWTRRELRKRNYDLVFSMQWPVLHTLIRPENVASKFVVDWCEIRSGFPYSWVQANGPKKGAVNTAVSDDTAQQIEQASGCKTRFLPSGIDLEDYDDSVPQARRTDLLYVGRLSEHKDVPLLIDAYEKLVQRGFPGKLHIGGDGPAAEEIRARRDRLNNDIKDNVVLHGSVTHAKKLELLANSAVLVIPSHREGFPVTLEEAMASGLPCVTVDRPGNGTRTVVKQFEVGAVTQPTPDAVAQGIQDVLADWSKYSDNSKKARDNFSWDAVVDQFVNLLR